MTAYSIYHDEEARGHILAGAEALYKAVSPTMGPRGRNVIIERSYQMPIITHDGVTVAKYVSPTDIRHRAPAYIIREAAEALNRLSGDGTTTVTVLTYHILKEANQLIEDGYNPMQLWKELEAAVPQLLAKIDELKEDVTTEERLAEVATISCADPELGKLIAHIVWQVGAEGTVSVEEGTGLTIETDIVKGYTFERGYLSPVFITDNTRSEAHLKDAYVYLTNKALTTAEEARAIAAALPGDARRLLLIAADVRKDALAYLSNLKTEEVIEAVAVKAPGFGDAQQELLTDLAWMTGGPVNTKTMTNISIEAFGHVQSAVVGKETTVLTGGMGDVTKRVEELRGQIESTDVELEKSLLKNRAAALDGKVAVIKVGGLTDGDVGEKKDRVDDAVAASIAALKDGIVAGGGVTPRDLSEGLEAVTTGEHLLKKVLKAPFVKLMDNAGFDGRELVEQDWKIGEGYDVTDTNLKPINMVKAGIIDPAQVTKQAIETAVTVASNLLTGGVLMVLEPEDGLSQDDLY